jgi:hypothetical protein
VFITGRSPQHCVSLTLDFLERVGARESPQIIAASVVKLLPCPAYRPTVVLREGFKPLSNDLEAIHDNISRNATRSRPCTIVVASESLTVTGATPRPITGPRAA